MPEILIESITCCGPTNAINEYSYLPIAQPGPMVLVLPVVPLWKNRYTEYYGDQKNANGRPVEQIEPSLVRSIYKIIALIDK